MTARPPRHARSTAAKSPAAAPGSLFVWQPRHGLLAAAMACLVARVLIPSESALDDVAGVFFAIAWMAIAGFTALEVWRNGAKDWRPASSELAILALALWHGAAAVVATRTGSPRPAINGAWLWLSYAAAYFSLRRLLLHELERRAAVAVMISLACAVSVFGIEQFAIEMPATRAAYYANPEAALRAAGVNISTDPNSRERILFEQRLESTEPFATFALTNSLAGFLTPWLLVACFVALQAYLRQSNSRWVWLGPLVSGVPIALCLLLTKSRSAYVATAAGMGVGLMLQPTVRNRLRPGWLLAGACALAALVALGAAVGALDREILTEAGKSLGYRTQYWRASWEMLADSPVFGVGPGQFQTVYTQYKAPTASEVVADPHNFLLEVAATSGVPALLLLLAFAFFVAREWMRSKEASPAATAEPVKSAGSTWIIAGGLLGVPLAFPIGLLAYSMPSAIAFFNCVPVMLAALGLWHAWGRQGTLDHVLPLLGAAALLVNLLAAGGIGIPAVAGTLWLLLALCAQPPLAADAHEARPRAWYPAIWTIGMGAAVLAAYFLSFRPMAAAQAARQAALAAPRTAEKHLLEAAAADPWAVTASRELAALRYHRWETSPSAENWQAVAEAIREALARSPQSALAWQHAGEQYLAAYRRMHDAALLEASIQAFEKATSLYPNSAAYHADLAEALADADQHDKARDHARRALELDDVMPHADLKLNERRRQMQAIVQGQAPQP